ncbi:hypothetical protein Tco_1514351 [Tanacetum coccineum]
MNDPRSANEVRIIKPRVALDHAFHAALYNWPLGVSGCADVAEGDTLKISSSWDSNSVPAESHQTPLPLD